MTATRKKPKRQFPTIPLMYFVAGVACIATETNLILEKLLRIEGGWSGISTAVVIAAIAQAVLAYAAEETHSQKQTVRFWSCMAAVIIVTAFTFTMSLDRAASMKQGVLQTQADANAQVARIEKELANARTTEKTGRSDPKCSRACMTANVDDVKRLEGDLKAALAARQITGAQDPVAVMVQKYTGIPADTYSTLQPLLMPAFLQLGGFLLISLACSGFAQRAQAEPVVAEPVPSPAPVVHPVLTVIKGGKLSDEEAEAIIVSDLARGIERNQEQYAELFGKSIATVSRMLDRLTSKPDAKIRSEKEGVRRKLYML